MPNYVVRYGVMRFLGVFSAQGNAAYRRGTRVIARTDRGLEDGEVLCEATRDRGGLPERPVRGPDPPRDDGGGRAASWPASASRPAASWRPASSTSPSSAWPCNWSTSSTSSAASGSSSTTWPRTGSISASWCRLLAGEFQTRIEMRQIGVRDEAKLLADYGDCGVPVCCNTHLVQMPPVSMKMAKLQKATLDPTKISGRCGRLKCCLRYEYEMYERRELPQAPPEQPPARGEEARPQEIDCGPVSRHACSIPRSSNSWKKIAVIRWRPTSSSSRRCTMRRTCWAWAPTSDRASRGPRRRRTDEEPAAAQHHVTGQELCEAIRRYALDQYGYMAKLVLNNWGIRSTGDFGEIVFNLIRIGRMRKTPATAARISTTSTISTPRCGRSSASRTRAERP